MSNQLSRINLSHQQRIRRRYLKVYNNFLRFQSNFGIITGSNFRLYLAYYKHLLRLHVLYKYCRGYTGVIIHEQIFLENFRDALVVTRPLFDDLISNIDKIIKYEK